jgi:hypothetical protein
MSSRPFPAVPAEGERWCRVATMTSDQATRNDRCLKNQGGMMARYLVSTFLIALMAREGACETRIPVAVIGSGSSVVVDTSPQKPLINVRIDIGTLRQIGDAIEAEMTWTLRLGRLADERHHYPDAPIPEEARTLSGRAPFTALMDRWPTWWRRASLLQMATSLPSRHTTPMSNGKRPKSRQTGGPGPTRPSILGICTASSVGLLHANARIRISLGRRRRMTTIPSYRGAASQIM